MNSNKKRSSNFSSNEIEFLLATISKYKNIIECKKTDRTSSEEKDNAWKSVEKDFNTEFGAVFRSWDILKTKYQNMKKGAKKNFALEKQQIYKTGGGPKPSSAVTALDNSIVELCDAEQIVGMESFYDDDVIFEEDILHDDQEGAIVCNLMEDKESVATIVEKEAEDGKENKPPSWAKYTPRLLKQPKTSTLASKKEKCTKDVWSNVAYTKIEKAKLEMELMKKESDARLSFMEKENELKIVKLNLEIELLKKQLNA